MPDYVFGREVTIKLPEPTREDEHSIHWEVEGVGGVTIRKPVDGDYSRDATVEKNKGIALALLAAVDYAESGENGE